MLVALLILFAPDLSATAAIEAETAAREALKVGNRLEALSQIETAMRNVESMEEKARLRDLYTSVPPTDAARINLVERTIVGIHIRNEKVRVYGKAADRLRGQGRRHAAIILHRAIIALHGGAGDIAKKEQKKIDNIVRSLTRKPSPEEKQQVKELVESKKSGKSLMKVARRLLSELEFRIVVHLCEEITVGEYDAKSRSAAIALKKEAEKKAATNVSVVEKKAALEVLTDERFQRLDTSVSRHFVFVGPAKFVSAIPKLQKTKLDLAYIFQSDLANVLRTHDGSRIVIYYQETFDFGGGLAVAGGKLIRIGAPAIRQPIASSLHYHELGHNIFGRGWLHRGHTEGIAEFAVAFTFDQLGEKRAAQNFVVGCRDQFVRFFLGRAMRFDHIQPYKPSAGFLFSFLPPGEAPYDWSPYRRMFHRMREAQFGSWPERPHQIMRYFGYLMAQEYGPQAYARLARWGWPVSRADDATVPAEAAELLSATKQGESSLARGLTGAAAQRFDAVLAATPDGHLANRARFGQLQLAVNSGDSATIDELQQRLGLLRNFLVLGAFHEKKQTAWVIIPPEWSIDLSKKEVQYLHRLGTWKRARVRPTGYVDLKNQGYGYPDNACAFALCYLRVDAETPARFWIGADDGHALYVNGELIHREPKSHPFLFDESFADTTLRAGWNRVLVKVHNEKGNWGFLLRAVQPNGSPIRGMEISTDDHEKDVASFVPGKISTTRVIDDGFKKVRSSIWKTTVGKFDTRNGVLISKETGNKGRWQRFDIDPDAPARGPANMLWLQHADLPRCDSFEAKFDVRGDQKWAVTIDGEDSNDGQSGHTLVFDSSDGGKKIGCTWYRYDRTLFKNLGVKVAKGPAHQYVIRRIGRKWWVSVDGQPMFTAADAKRLPAHGFGLMTWGKNPGFDRVTLTRLKRSLKPGLKTSTSRGR